MTLLAPFLLGALVGLLFALAGLPVPAPSSLAGVLGVAGLWAGWAAVGWWR